MELSVRRASNERTGKSLGQPLTLDKKSLVFLVYLVSLVYLVYLVYLLYLVYFEATIGGIASSIVNLLIELEHHINNIPYWSTALTDLLSDKCRPID